jgi:tetratricopeptide (TPR) repeat protein
MVNNNSEGNQNPKHGQNLLSILSNLRVIGDLTVGDITQISLQVIVYLWLPPGLRPFALFISILIYIGCIIYGFFRLFNGDVGFITNLLLIIGSVFLSLTCIYYVWFWHPESEDTNQPTPSSNESDGNVKLQQAKEQQRKLTRRSAMIGAITIPLLTIAGYAAYYNIPTKDLIVLVAEFRKPGSKQDDDNVTEEIISDLREATAKLPVNIKPLGNPITSQPGKRDDEVAEQEGFNYKATIVIWGFYRKPNEENIGLVFGFKVLKPLKVFPSFGLNTGEKEQLLRLEGPILSNTLNPAESFKTNLPDLTVLTVGLVSYSLEKWDSAINSFNNALEQQQKQDPVLKGIISFYRGNAYAYKQNYIQSIADFTQCIGSYTQYAQAKLKQDIDLKAYNSDLGTVYNNRGIVYNEKGDYDQAIADLNQALKLKPDYAEAYNNRAIIYAQKGNYDQAIADISQALKLKPDNADAYNNRGIVYDKKGDYDQAIADLTQALKLKPEDNAEAYSNRANAYVNKGNYDQAIADCTQALKLKPNLAEAYAIRGSAYAKKSDYDQAITDLNQAINLKPKLAQAYSTRGLVYSIKGNYDQAIADCTQALKLNPDLAEAYGDRGLAYRGKRDYDQAIADFTQALKLKPDSAETYSNRGSAYRDKGNYDQAIADFAQAINLKPDSASAYSSRGLVYINKRDYDQAIADLTQAINLKPNLEIILAEAYSNRGSAYFSKRDYDRAIADLTQAINLNPNFPVVYILRGSAYKSKGDKSNAIADFKQGLKLSNDPNLRQSVEEELRKLGVK